MSPSRIRVGLFTLCVIALGCGGSEEQADTDTLPAQRGIQGGFVGSGGAGGGVPGNRPGVDAGTTGTPVSTSDTTSASDTEGLPFGDVDNTEDATGPSEEDVSLEPDTEQINPWEGMEDMEGAILLTDVDSTFDDADIASAGAFFGLLPTPVDPLATYDNCQVIEGDDDTALPTSVSLDGGPILFEGLSIPLSAVHGQTEAGVYTSSLAEGTPDIFLPSGDISISSQGSSEFPPFSLVMATPTPLNVQSPDLGGGTKIDRNQPLTLSWTASPESNFMNVFMAGVSTSGDFLDGPRVTCTVDGDPGSITVPSAALKMLPVESSLFGGGYILIGVTRGTTGTSLDSPLPVNSTALRSTGGIVEAD